MRTDLEKNDAVSPVVGVMLMLVVTIIVAAVVAAFASGLGGSTSAAQTASFEWTLHASGGVPIKTGSYTPGDTTQTNWNEPGVVCSIPVSSGDFSSNDLKIITSYTVPEKFEDNTLADAGKTITTATNGRVEDFEFSMRDVTSTYGTITNTVNGITVPHYVQSLDPFDTTVDRNFICMTNILPTQGNGATTGSKTEWNEVRFFGGKNLIGSGTVWWFKDISALLGFDITKRSTYGFTEGSVVHITVLHIPSNTVIYDKDVKAVW